MSDEGDAGELAPRADGEDRFADDRPRPTPLWALLSRWLVRWEGWLRSHGGRPLRMAIGGFWIAVTAIAAFLLVGPVINPPLGLEEITDSAENATDTWIARDFDVDYTLTRDDDGRLQAEVVETITAFFPDDVDESGIRRVLSTQYQGHDLAPREVTASIDGVAVDPRLRESGDRLTFVLDTGDRLSGDHEFVLRYRIQDLAYTSTDDITGDAVDLLEWSVFGPDWPQGFAALDVSVTVPDELDALLVRQPFGGVSWTLVSGTDWLEPEEDSPPGQKVYAFTVDQNVPPHAAAWFRMLFPAGTFTMPPPTGLFLLQTFGPLLPLAILLLTLPFAIAARAVAWSDARGRPWYVAQHEPPKGVSVAQAIQIVRRPRNRELALAVDEVRGSRRSARRAALIAAGRAARRSGRVGDGFRARAAYLLDRARSRQIADGFRRIPSGFVRDWFIAAPLALTVVQLAIIRQLSHQETLAVIWWPGVFVLVSLAVSAVVLWLAVSARPLTRKGALARQYLAGIDVYARRTSALERTTLGDALLPYAVVAADPREAGRRVSALVERELGGDAELRAWRTTDFLSWPRLLVRAAALLIVAGAVVLVAVMPNPYLRLSTYDRWDFEDAGTLYTRVASVAVDAHLSADGDRPRLAIVQTAVVDFDDESARVPQFATPVLTRVEGQSLGLKVDEVRVDGEAVPFHLSIRDDTGTITTAMTEVRSGRGEVEVRYTYTSPAVAGEASRASGREGERVDRIRWAGLVDGWESGWTYPSEPDPVTVSVRVDDDVAQQAFSAGWLREDPGTSEDARDWKDSSYPFGTLESELEPAPSSGAKGGTITESDDTSSDARVYSFEVTHGEYGYPTDSLYSDLGVLMEFPAGTWEGPDPAARDAEQLAWAMPTIVVLSTAAVAVVLGVAAVLVWRVRGTRQMSPGLVRDVFWWLTPAAAVGAIIVGVWATADIPADWPEVALQLPACGLALVAAIAAAVAVRPVAAPRRPDNRAWMRARDPQRDA
ncbi:DUF2207 domain-containing protein [Microbacterium binotii]|uniref:DUF2207 domain-containing protein n=1 Tax=Microbacterium binotii TaxID=462710 RepID=UPI001F2FE69B|nr:DUF2207 domain-containing protein [Microbacterium binotii]UIN31990.1 DUF2207 domain-containing protein [Microbacterium binotii]